MFYLLLNEFDEIVSVARNAASHADAMRDGYVIVRARLSVLSSLGAELAEFVAENGRFYPAASFALRHL